MLFKQKIVRESSGDLVIGNQIGHFPSQDFRQIPVGRHLDQGEVLVNIHRMDADNLSAEFQHRLAQPIKIRFVCSSLSISPMRCLKIAIFRLQKEDSGFLATMSLWMA
ncbi:hypothetical protein D3C77_469240 [compost metagenome]